MLTLIFHLHFPLSNTAVILIMKLTQEQSDKIAPTFPAQYGNVAVDHYAFLNAVLRVMENRYKWRVLPEHFDVWSTIYKRFRRWSES